MYLFHRRNGLFLRYDENKNMKGNKSKTGDLSLQLFDPYAYLPDFKELTSNKNKVLEVDRICAIYWKQRKKVKTRYRNLWALKLEE